MIFKNLYLIVYTWNFERGDLHTDGMMLRLPGATTKFVDETINMCHCYYIYHHTYTHALNGITAVPTTYGTTQT